jgi:uncharacterized protein
MPASFLHGIEIIEVDSGPVPVTVVKSAVIGLVGTAPSWAVQAPAVAPAVNTPTLVSSSLDAARFGAIVLGYTIPYALAAIQNQGAGQAIVVNVFDPTRHFTAVAATALPFNTQGAINLGHMGVSNVVVTSDPAGTTYVAGTDYTLDPVNGVITLIPTGSGGHIASSATVLVAFNYADPTKIEDADIIGAVTSGVYTGIQALQTTYGTMGFFAKILIAPGYSQFTDVATAEITMANTIRAVTLIDSPPSTPVASAISNRGASGNAFNTSSKRAILCYPQETFYDTGIVPTGVTLSTTGTPLTSQVNALAVGAYSSWVAGSIAAQDLANGYWWSPSNVEIEGILGPDVQLYSSAVDANSDVNNLNANGILTVFNAFGTGLRCGATARRHSQAIPSRTISSACGAPWTSSRSRSSSRCFSSSISRSPTRSSSQSWLQLTRSSGLSSSVAPWWPAAPAMIQRRIHPHRFLPANWCSTSMSCRLLPRSV